MRYLRSLWLLSAALILTTTPAFADQLFHSEELSLSLTTAGMTAGFPPLRSGHVVDIHPNGPMNFAIEEYLLNGAQPDTSYAVVLNIGDPSCPVGGSTIPFPNNASVVTDANGNGHAKAKFSLAEANALGLRHKTFGLSWSFWAGGFPGGVPAYGSPCILVRTD